MPSGDYAWVNAGTVVDVQSLAEAMIWHSDNTATDHLIDFLGRENVEEAFAAYGHSDPESNFPLLMTRELFGIKMSQTAQWMDRYMSATDDEQARLLQEQIDPMTINPNAGWGNWNGPTAIDGIEWFASAEDLCRATSGVQGRLRGGRREHDLCVGAVRWPCLLRQRRLQPATRRDRPVGHPGRADANLRLPGRCLRTGLLLRPGVGLPLGDDRFDKMFSGQTRYAIESGRALRLRENA